MICSPGLSYYQMLKRLTLALFVLALATIALAEKKPREPQEKSVSGIVTDADGAPVPRAVVQLKNTKTLQVRSFIATETGDYYFHGLATDVDYEIKAESNGKVSASKTLSSFDTHPEARINLQIK
jgi:hypothetical protein